MTLNIASPLKTAVRVFVALFVAIFLSLSGSAQVCSIAARGPVWPHWADFVCGHNVGVFWLLSAPPLFIFILYLAGRPTSRPPAPSDTHHSCR